MFLGIFILQVKEDVDIKRWEGIVLIGILITTVLIWVGDKYIQALNIGLDISNGATILSGYSAMFWLFYLRIPRQKNSFSPHSETGAEFFDKSA